MLRRRGNYEKGFYYTITTFVDHSTATDVDESHLSLIFLCAGIPLSHTVYMRNDALWDTF